MLNASLRKSLPARLAAVGFIIFILFGNLRLALGLIGGEVPAWMSSGFILGIVLALAGGVGLVFLQTRTWLASRNAGTAGDDQP